MKRMLTKVVLVGTMAAMTCGVVAAGPTVPGDPTPMPRVQAQPGRLTVEQLGTLLDNLGLNPKPFNNKDGKVVGYNVEFESGGWTLRFGISLSNDGSKVWFDGGLVTLTDLAGLQPQALLGLLEQNDGIAPAYVYYFRPRSNLRLSMPLDNRELTPAVMRGRVNFFGEVIKAVIVRYQKESKPVQPNPPVPAPIPSM